jgi:hypothetical protein
MHLSNIKLDPGEKNKRYEEPDLLENRVVDPDSMILWIRIRNLDPGSGSSGRKRKKKCTYRKDIFAIFIN